jgi:adhesin transport system outer membrane protein
MALFGRGFADRGEGDRAAPGGQSLGGKSVGDKRPSLVRRAALCGVAMAAPLLLSLGLTGPASALSLKEAVAIALESNPEIGQAAENREAIQFELRQARGLYMPRVDLEASAGARRLDSSARRLAGIDGRTLNPYEISIVATQKLFDGFATRSEVERQASRVDGASYRVLERSEFIALQIARQYFEILLQSRIVNLARENVAIHERILGEIREGEAGGTLTAADTQQAQERVIANRARLIEAQEELSAAQIRFNTLVAVPVGQVSMPPAMRNLLPGSLDAAIGLARANNPRIRMALADVDAADAVRRGARAPNMPEIFLEGRARAGRDIDGASGRSTDLQGRIVLRMNLFDGGITSANEQEQIRRATEERLRMHQVHREIEEDVRLSWDRRRYQGQILGELRTQLGFSDQVVSSYEEQFQVGRRSLLDVLDAYNTRYNVRVLNETAQFAIAFADYRLLASTGQLLSGLGLSAPRQAVAYAREGAGVPPTAPAVTDRRVLPPVNPFR